MNFYVRLTIAILIVILLAEVAPEAVNALLALLLVGLIVGRWQAFAGLAYIIASVGR